MRADVREATGLTTSSTDRTIMTAPDRCMSWPSRALEMPRAGVVRQTVELLVLLCLCVLLVRTFSAEAYVVPTGSMAPTLLGLHRELTCPNCGSCSWSGSTRRDRPARRSARIAASAAWTRRRRSSAAATACWCRSSSTISGGRSAGRWPSFISRASRPGLCQARGRVCRANRSGSLAATSSSTADRPEVAAGDPGDADPGPRQPVPTSRCRAASRAGSFDRGSRDLRRSRAAGYRGRPVRAQRRRVVAIAAATTGSSTSTGTRPEAYGPVRDFYAYNGGDLRADNEVDDLGLEARLRVGDAVECDLGGASVRLRSVRGADPGRPGGDRSSWSETIGGYRLTNCRNPFEESGFVAANRHAGGVGLRSPGAGRDRRAAPFRSVRLRRSGSRRAAASESPIALGVRGGRSRSPSCGSIATSTTPARWPTRRAIRTG